MNLITNTSFRIGRALLAALALGFAATSAAFASSGTRYYVNDHLAATVAIADAAGVIAAMEADAFGSPLAGGGDAARFTGKPYDDDLGAYVFPFRNYRADEARWMSADPSGFPDGVNGRFYSGNPTTGLDSLGLAWVTASNTYSNQYVHLVTRYQDYTQEWSATANNTNTIVGNAGVGAPINSVTAHMNASHTGSTITNISLSNAAWNQDPESPESVIKLRSDLLGDVSIPTGISNSGQFVGRSSGEPTTTTRVLTTYEHNVTGVNKREQLFDRLTDWTRTCA